MPTQSDAELYRVVSFEEKHGNCGGSLVMFQPGAEPDGFSFPIRKVLLMSDIDTADVRGRHAHFHTQELLICIQGGCTVHVEDASGRRATIRLSRRNEALLLYPHVWRTVREFAEGTLLLAIADTEYDERDYIRNYQRFKEVYEPNGGQ